MSKHFKVFLNKQEKDLLFFVINYSICPSSPRFCFGRITAVVGSLPRSVARHIRAYLGLVPNLFAAYLNLVTTRAVARLVPRIDMLDLRAKY